MTVALTGQLQNVAARIAVKNGSPARALRAMWRLPYVEYDERIRVASLPVGNRSIAIMITNYANGITVEYKWNRTPITFSHLTDASSIAATFNLSEHVDVIAAMIDFDEAADEKLQSSNIGEWVKK